MEHNLDFTTVDLQRDFDETAELATCAEQPEGVLPKLLAMLVARRRSVKRQMKALSKNCAEYAALDIKQLSVKLVANSLYGTLGYVRSRFYAPQIAALITAHGRKALRDAKLLIEQSFPYQVIYGDTDSLMLSTGITASGATVRETYATALQLAHEVVAEVNKQYRKLELEFESVFRRLLLVGKKNYAAAVFVRLLAIR
uniref:DNA-directed DNA polymerase n=1 Tax=Dermatophagoides pteronyssinus TaxID=6956 RepID=A0A6P6Y7M6_DERPT|nr:DNA polymerase alpha catalytic subunit-like [Dermatophagoides pteronyssinus]